MKQFYYTEWMIAKEEGNLIYASDCKEMYKQCVLKEIVKQHNQYIEKISQYPMLWLNQPHYLERF